MLKDLIDGHESDEVYGMVEALHEKHGLILLCTTSRRPPSRADSVYWLESNKVQIQNPQFERFWNIRSSSASEQEFVWYFPIKLASAAYTYTKTGVWNEDHGRWRTTYWNNNVFYEIAPFQPNRVSHIASQLLWKRTFSMISGTMGYKCIRIISVRVNPSLYRVLEVAEEGKLDDALSLLGLIARSVDPSRTLWQFGHPRTYLRLQTVYAQHGALHVFSSWNYYQSNTSVHSWISFDWRKWRKNRLAKVSSK